MRIEEVRELSIEELARQLDEQQRALMNLKFQQATLQLKDNTAIRKTRRDIARIKTVITERAIAGRL